MEVQKIGEGSPDPSRWNIVRESQRVAEENVEAKLRTQPVPTAPTPVQPQDKTYSPTLYAQAAQFQLYTQSGALAAMLAQSGAVPPVVTPSTDSGDAITAVDASGSSNKLDLQA